ncbi:hypothetical protein [Thermococcus sp.]
MSDKLSTSSVELKEIEKFVEYIEKLVRESDIGLSPKSVELIKRKYFELKMKAKIEIESVPKFMENVAFSKMKELDFLELRLETALQLASDKYTLQEMHARCDALKNTVEVYKALAFAFASVLAIIVGAIISRLI